MQQIAAMLPLQRRRGVRSPFATLSWSTSVALPSPKVVTEPKTGLPLQTEHCSSRGACAQLAGQGVRVKRIAGLAQVQVYALGVLIDGLAARKALAAKYRTSASAASLASALCAEAISLDVEKTLQLVFARAVGGDAVSGALAERLEPQLGRASPALEAFKDAFKGAKLSRGSVVNLCCSKGGRLSVSVDGRAAKPILSSPLCSALFDVYLGKDPVVPEAKAAFGAALAATFLAK